MTFNTQCAWFVSLTGNGYNIYGSQPYLNDPSINSMHGYPSNKQPYSHDITALTNAHRNAVNGESAATYRKSESTSDTYRKTQETNGYQSQSSLSPKKLERSDTEVITNPILSQVRDGEGEIFRKHSDGNSQGNGPDEGGLGEDGRVSGVGQSRNSGYQRLKNESPTRSQPATQRGQVQQSVSSKNDLDWDDPGRGQSPAPYGQSSGNSPKREKQNGYSPHGDQNYSPQWEHGRSPVKGDHHPDSPVREVQNNALSGRENQTETSNGSPRKGGQGKLPSSQNKDGSPTNGYERDDERSREVMSATPGLLDDSR